MVYVFLSFMVLVINSYVKLQNIRSFKYLEYIGLQSPAESITRACTYTACAQIVLFIIIPERIITMYKPRQGFLV